MTWKWLCNNSEKSYQLASKSSGGKPRVGSSPTFGTLLKGLTFHDVSPFFVFEMSFGHPAFSIGRPAFAVGGVR